MDSVKEHTHSKWTVCYMVSRCPWFLTASGRSFEECFERRSGGRGAFSAENAGPVRCRPAQKCHEGTQKKILSLMLTLVNVDDVMEHICSKSTDLTFTCYFLCWMTSTHFHVLFCSKRTIWHAFFFFLKFGQQRVISVYSMCISL